MKQSEKFNHLGVSFTSDGRQNSEQDIRIGKASAVMGQLHRFVVALKRELSTKASYSSLVQFLLLLQSWIMDENPRPRVLSAEMGFMRRISG